MGQPRILDVGHRTINALNCYTLRITNDAHGKWWAGYVEVSEEAATDSALRKEILSRTSCTYIGEGIPLTSFSGHFVGFNTLDPMGMQVGIESVWDSVRVIAGKVSSDEGFRPRSDWLRKERMATAYRMRAIHAIGDAYVEMLDGCTFQQRASALYNLLHDRNELELIKLEVILTDAQIDRLMSQALQIKQEGGRPHARIMTTVDRIELEPSWKDEGSEPRVILISEGEVFRDR